MSKKSISVKRLSVRCSLPAMLVFFCLLPPVWTQGDRDRPLDGLLSGGLNQNEPVVSSEETWCLTDSECSFSVVLPDILPAQVSLGNLQVPAGVDFLSSYKDMWVEGEKTGTCIRLVFSFSQGGTFQLPPLDVMVDGQLYQIPFAPVEVFQNPRSLKPQLGLSFQDDRGQKLFWEETGLLQVVAGKPLFVQVDLQYGSGLTGIRWDLIPDALFQQVADYQDSFNQGAAELSHQFLPVARFSLTPLKAGLIEVPPISVEVVGYDGNTYNLSTGTVALLVQREDVAAVSSSEIPAAESPGALEAAFAQPPVMEDAEDLPVSVELAQSLAALRWAERKSLFGAAHFQQRVQMEQDLGLGASERERSLILAWLIIGCGFLILGTTVVLLLKKKAFLSVVLGFLCIVILVLGVVYLAPLLRHTGILASRNLSIIPEQGAVHLFPVTPYSLVTIQDEVLGWYFVSAEGLEGWIPKEMVVLIQGAENTGAKEGRM